MSICLLNIVMENFPKGGENFERTNENPKGPIKLKDIERELLCDAVLYEDIVLEDRDLDPEILEELESGSMRDLLHSRRLINRGGIEKDFAIAYVRYYLIPGNSTDHPAFWVLISEGADTQMFWTFAPYVFRSLCNRGCSKQDAINVLLDWASSGVSLKKCEEHEDYNEVHLKGLEFINDHFLGPYVLDKDPNHISHKFTAQEAERIADMLLV